MTMETRETTDRRLTPHPLYIAVALALFVLLASAWSERASAMEVTDENVATLIEQATTAQEHEALAAYFRSKADEAASQAQRHQAMLTATTKRGRSVMRAHCQKLIEAFEQQEKDYRAMAEEEAELARAAAQAP